jgi:hypothetical protein
VFNAGCGTGAREGRCRLRLQLSACLPWCSMLQPPFDVWHAPPCTQHWPVRDQRGHDAAHPTCASCLYAFPTWSCNIHNCPCWLHSLLTSTLQPYAPYHDPTPSSTNIVRMDGILWHPLRLYCTIANLARVSCLRVLQHASVSATLTPI